MSRRAGLLLALPLLAAGCGPTDVGGPAGTGAREVAQAYFEALARQDWPAAYARLTADSKGRVSADQFARLASEYRRGLGFDPQAAHVTACDEHGAKAVAHVTLSGKGSHRHRYKDAVALRRGEVGWAVVLPATFGRAGKS